MLFNVYDADPGDGGIIMLASLILPVEVNMSRFKCLLILLSINAILDSLPCLVYLALLYAIGFIAKEP